MFQSSDIKRKPEVIAGIFFLLTGFSIIITLLTDIEFLSAVSPLSEDIEYLSENKTWLQLNSLMWIASSLLMMISTASMIAALVPHQAFLGYLYGFSLLLSSIMFCLAGINGLFTNSILGNILENELPDPEILKANIYILAREKEIYLTSAYNLIGLSFFVIGIFSYVTLKIPVMVGMLSSITGIMIPVFTLIIPDSILADLGLVFACCMFFILTLRFLFRGLGRRRKKSGKPDKGSLNPEIIQ